MNNRRAVNGDGEGIVTLVDLREDVYYCRDEMRRHLSEMNRREQPELTEEAVFWGWSLLYSFLLVILIVLGVFFAEWRASEKDVLKQLTKLNQALAFLELRD
tara:strand:- start:97 stop:402 length:306 start_codon:yes stop_codon:yes gene_type:complete